jgi:hypothetical protein
VVNTRGIIDPPASPCRARKAIILWMFHAQPHSRLISVKPAAEAANSQRVDMTRASQPESGIIMISAIR